MEENVFCAMLRRIAQIEQTESLESFVIRTTFGTDKHTMNLRDYSFTPQLGKVYQEFDEMELADLVDLQNFVGEFDGEFS